MGQAVLRQLVGAMQEHSVRGSAPRPWRLHIRVCSIPEFLVCIGCATGAPWRGMRCHGRWAWNMAWMAAGVDCQCTVHVVGREGCTCAKDEAGGRGQ